MICFITCDNKTGPFNGCGPYPIIVHFYEASDHEPLTFGLFVCRQGERTKWGQSDFVRQLMMALYCLGYRVDSTENIGLLHAQRAFFCFDVPFGKYISHAHG
jgi:hypothetical protein